LILILILALVLFGPKKLPELGRAIGQTLKEFKNATRGLTQEDEDSARKPQTAAAEIKDPEREKLEQEIRERVQAEIREKMEQERLRAEKEQPKA